MAGPSFSPGKYWGKLSSAQLGAAKTGTPQFVMTFAIMGGINPADPDGELLPCASFERTVYRAITEKTKDWFWRDVDSLCAAKGIDTKPATPSEVAACDLVGAEIALECTHEAYEGRTQERWSIVSGGGGPEVKPLEGSEAAKLDALFGRGKPAAKVQRRATTPVTQATPEEVSAARTANGDIPF